MLELRELVGVHGWRPLARARGSLREKMLDPRQPSIVSHLPSGNLIEPAADVLSVELSQAPHRDDENVLGEVGDVGGTATEGSNPALDIQEILVVDALEGER